MLNLVGAIAVVGRARTAGGALLVERAAGRRPTALHRGACAVSRTQRSTVPAVTAHGGGQRLWLCSWQAQEVEPQIPIPSASVTAVAAALQNPAGSAESTHSQRLCCHVPGRC